MKFSLVLSGAAAASAAVIARGDYPVDSCPAVKKTVTLSWIEVVQFTKMVAKTPEQLHSSYVANSKYDVKQVYPYLTTKPGKYPTGGSGPYGNSTGPYGNGTSTGSGSASPTGGSTATTTTSSGPSSTPTNGGSNPSDGSCTNPSTRVEWRNMDDGARTSFVQAIGCLMNAPSGLGGAPKNRYEDFAYTHQQQTPNIHGYGNFLLWHRYFVHVFYDVMRTECGYSGPEIWWNEALDAGNFGNAPMFTDQWLGQLPTAVDGSPVCIDTAGYKTDGAYIATIGPEYATENPHCLSRALDDGASANTKQSDIDNCYGAQNYDDYRQCLEGGVHAYGHNAFGSIMANVPTSPEDPAFWLHHGLVDQVYTHWQGLADDGHRYIEVGGASPSGGSTTPEDVLSTFGIRPDITIADVLNPQGGYLCYQYDA